MKYLLALVAVLFVSCATVPTTVPDRFWSLQEVNEWIYYNIEYKGEPKSVDEAQTPSQTMSLRSGVCIDMCFLFVELAKGWDVKVVYIKTPTGLHTVVQAGASGYYDPTNNRDYGWTLPKGWSIYSF